MRSARPVLGGREGRKTGATSSAGLANRSEKDQKRCQPPNQGGLPILEAPIGPPDRSGLNLV